MAEGIFVEQDGRLVDMRQASYVSEDALQALLERHVVLLAGDQMSPDVEPRRFLLVRREAGVPGGLNESDRWSVDHVFIDQDAIPTLVEVKRSTDTRIRREVIGQMFDYAANAVAHWPEGALAEHFNATHESDDGGPTATLRSFLGHDDEAPDKVEHEIEAWWRQAEANLRSGRLRLLFVADAIPSELRRIIEFLNEQMATTEVLGIEIRNYEGDGLRALVPRVVGLTEAATDRKRRQSGPTVPLSEVWANAPSGVVEARRLLDEWAARTGVDVIEGGKSRRYRVGALTLIYLYPGGPYRLVSFYIRALPDDGERVRLHAFLQALRPGAKVSPKDPSLSCDFVVQNWTALANPFLDQFAEAAKRILDTDDHSGVPPGSGGLGG